jgi:3-methyladenine DNA glycosylase AlkD
MNPDVDEFVAALKRSGTRMRAVHEKRYLKSDGTFFGVPVPVTRRLARPLAAEFRNREDLTGAIRFSRALWSTKAHEPRVAAIVIVSTCEDLFDDRVWDLGRHWLDTLDNWAHCDGVAPGLLSPFIQTGRPRHKSRRREVLRWTRDTNLWVRRGALLANMRSVRYDKEWRFLLDVAGRLLDDPESFVQKGLGWMLRECAHHNPREVITFIQTHRACMRRSTITNAVSRLPKTLQKAARNG